MKKGASILEWNRRDAPEGLRDREWLVCNGLGGFASGSLLGVPTRRYHGILVPNLAHPKGRHIMISRLDELAVAGRQRVRLSGAQFAGGGMETDVQKVLAGFNLQWQVPTWTFEFAGRTLQKSIVMPYRQNTVCIAYRLLDGAPLQMRLRPFTAFRRQDAPLARDAPACTVRDGEHDCRELRDSTGELAVRFAMQSVPASFHDDPLHERSIYYHVEHQRGYEAAEDLYSPGYLDFELTTAWPAAFVATTGDWRALDIEVDRLIDGQAQRCRKLLEIARVPADDEFAARLVLAADQFIILPGSRQEEAVVAEASGDDVRTIIAGYHWFGDWGRDTMISLEGLTLCTGRFREARAILKTFSGYVQDGLLPNLFPEGEREALYHTADATLWYFQAIERYAQRAGDPQLIEELYHGLREIIDRHVRGTRFGIGVDPADGLLHAGEEGYQLTWMDAKVDGWVVTPRRGKPVEIQALWYNALCLMAEWSQALGHPVQAYRDLAERARQSFNERFWNQGEGCLFDVVDGEQGDDPSVRPNQVLAISLTHPILEKKRWQAVMEKVVHKLLTPYGLRTLSPDDARYQRNYHGDLRTRDAAYHQGTVWPWLIGPFVDAWLRVKANPEGARALLRGFPSHLAEAGIGSISEIFDAERPYVPRGCIAQAWSVAEVLRAWSATAATAAGDSTLARAPERASSAFQVAGPLASPAR